jgi:hypothetical protein
VTGASAMPYSGLVPKCGQTGGFAGINAACSACENADFIHILSSS